MSAVHCDGCGDEGCPLTCPGVANDDALRAIAEAAGPALLMLDRIVRRYDSLSDVFGVSKSDPMAPARVAAEELRAALTAGGW